MGVNSICVSMKTLTYQRVYIMYMQEIAYTSRALKAMHADSLQPDHNVHIARLLSQLTITLMTLPNVTVIGADKPAFFDFENRSATIPFLIHAPAFTTAASYTPEELDVYGEPEEGSYLLHHKYVKALLSDLFGINIETSDAINYSGSGDFDLVSDIMSEITGCNDWEWSEIQSALAQPEPGQGCNKAGWCTVTVSEELTEADVLVVAEAIKVVALCGWKMLPQYRVDVATGDWTHKNAPRRSTKPENISPSPSCSPTKTYSRNSSWRLMAKHAKEAAAAAEAASQPVITLYTRQECIAEALEGAIAGAKWWVNDNWKDGEEFEKGSPNLSNMTRCLRWWLLPSEVATCLQNADAIVGAQVLFVVPSAVFEFFVLKRVDLYYIS